MKKAFISLLGMAGYRHNKEIAKASYHFSNSLKEKFILKRSEYPNMLVLAIENFPNYTHECISSKMAVKIQKEILTLEDIDLKRVHFNIVDNIESDYSIFLRQINNIMNRYDRVIIDISHGFRHMPILSIFALFNQNIRNQEKIEYIFYAKEVTALKEYEIIDLKENFEAINFSYMINSFNNNYTTPSNIHFENPYYQEFANKLSKFSEYFTSNPKELLKETLIDEIITMARDILDIEDFDSNLLLLIDNLEYIRSLKDKEEWIQFYEFSKLMNQIGNQLNAVMYLYDAIDFYCLYSLEKIDIVYQDIFKYNKYIEQYNNFKYSLYSLVNNTRALIKLGEKYQHSSTSPYTQQSASFVSQYLNKIERINEFRNLIRDIEYLRNSMVHSSSHQIDIFNIKNTYLNLLRKFEILCIQKDILSINQEKNIALLNNIKIENFFSIKKINLRNLKEKREIYIVGENGDGKTLLLQAITIGLKGTVEDGLEEFRRREIEFEIAIEDKDKIQNNFFAYGASRGNYCQIKEDIVGYLTLFSSEYDLKSPTKWLIDLYNAENAKEETVISLDKAIKLLQKLLNRDIEIEVTFNSVTFREKGSIVSFEQLSSGYRSVITIICDLISRFSQNQKVEKIEDFKGVILIDELELHLHPKWQYSFLQKLKEIFPLIQFMVTTHSPTVLLGASKDAVFYKVYKENGETKISQPINSIKNFMANTLNTSPLFDMETARARNSDGNLDTREDYISAKIHNIIKEKVKDKKVIVEEDIDEMINQELNSFLKENDL